MGYFTADTSQLSNTFYLKAGTNEHFASGRGYWSSLVSTEATNFAELGVPTDAISIGDEIIVDLVFKYSYLNYLNTGTERSGIGIQIRKGSSTGTIIAEVYPPTYATRNAVPVTVTPIGVLPDGDDTVRQRGRSVHAMHHRYTTTATAGVSAGEIASATKLYVGFHTGAASFSNSLLSTQSVFVFNEHPSVDFGYGDNSAGVFPSTPVQPDFSVVDWSQRYQDIYVVGPPGHENRLGIGDGGPFDFYGHQNTIGLLSDGDGAVYERMWTDLSKDGSAYNNGTEPETYADVDSWFRGGYIPAQGAYRLPFETKQYLPPAADPITLARMFNTRVIPAGTKIMFSLYFGYDYSQTISSATTDAPNTFRLMEFEFVSSSFTEDTSTPHTVTTTKAAGLYDSYFRQFRDTITTTGIQYWFSKPNYNINDATSEVFGNWWETWVEVTLDADLPVEHALWELRMTNFPGQLWMGVFRMHDMRSEGIVQRVTLERGVMDGTDPFDLHFAPFTVDDIDDLFTVDDQLPPVASALDMIRSGVFGLEDTGAIPYHPFDQSSDYAGSGIYRNITPGLVLYKRGQQTNRYLV